MSLSKTNTLEIVKASKEGNAYLVSKLIVQCTNLDIQDEEGKTALMGASWRGHKEIAFALIENGASLDIQDEEGNTALMGASWNGHKEIAFALIEKGASLDTQDNYGKTALICASLWGHFEIAFKLIKAGADLEIQDNDGMTALICASWKGQKEIKLLDPNLTASVDCMHLLRSLRKTNALIDFTQGLDIRFLNNEMIELLKTMRIKRFHFAYDRLVDSKTIEQNLINFRDKTGYHKPSHNNVTVYVLVNYETSLAEDLYRLQFIRKLGFQPYVMIYNKHDLIKGKSIYFKLQRWVNNPPFFWKYSDFEAYLKAYQLRRCV